MTKPTREEVILAIALWREENKNLWKELAESLGVEWKTERAHNDGIIRVLKLAQRQDARALLDIISRNDHKIADGLATLASSS